MVSWGLNFSAWNHFQLEEHPELSTRHAEDFRQAPHSKLLTTITVNITIISLLIIINHHLRYIFSLNYHTPKIRYTCTRFCRNRHERLRTSRTCRPLERPPGSTGQRTTQQAAWAQAESVSSSPSRTGAPCAGTPSGPPHSLTRCRVEGVIISAVHLEELLRCQCHAVHAKLRTQPQLRVVFSGSRSIRRSQIRGRPWSTCWDWTRARARSWRTAARTASEDKSGAASPRALHTWASVRLRSAVNVAKLQKVL